MGQHIRVSLTPDQHERLTHLVGSGKAPARVTRRARILLLGDRGSCQTDCHTHKRIAAGLHVSLPMIRAILRRFASEGMEAALAEKPRPGKAPKITGEIEAQLALLACSDPPEGHSRWTMQLLADKMIELKWVESITDTTVCERLKKKRDQAVAGEAVLHRQAVSPVRGQDGGCAERVRAAV